MYKKILVPVEPSHVERHQEVLKMALALREDENSEILALSVIETMPGYFGRVEGLQDVQIKASEKTLQELKDFAASHSAIKTKLLYGHPANEINEYAANEGVDCIIVASHKPELADYLIGSTAARVVRHAPCSVHVMR